MSYSRLLDSFNSTYQKALIVSQEELVAGCATPKEKKKVDGENETIPILPAMFPNERFHKLCFLGRVYLARSLRISWEANQRMCLR